MSQQQFDHLVAAATGLAGLRQDESNSKENSNLFYQCEDCFTAGETTYVMKCSAHWRKRHRRTNLTEWEIRNSKTPDQFREWLDVQENRDRLNHHVKFKTYRVLGVQYDPPPRNDNHKRPRIDAPTGKAAAAAIHPLAIVPNAAAAPAPAAIAVVPPSSNAKIVMTPEMKENLINHALTCNSNHCFSARCHNLRNRMAHVRNNCIIENCNECKYYYDFTLSFHTKICKNDKCQVPKCLETRYVNAPIVIDLTMD
jgi:hypothetical protein